MTGYAGTAISARTVAGSSELLEAAAALPIGDHLAERGPFLLGRVHQVRVHRRPERLGRDLTLLELFDGVDNVPRHARHVRRVVCVALKALRRSLSMLDAVQSGRHRGREGKVRVAVGAGDAGLDAEPCAVPDHAEPAGAV